MYNAYNAKLFQDTNDPVGPRPNTSPYAFIYFLLYMCIMTLVLLNMFIGFVIVTFQEVGVKAFRESKLDRNQVEYMYMYLLSCLSSSQGWVFRYFIHLCLHVCTIQDLFLYDQLTL